MIATLVTLVGAVVVFLWVLYPLFGKPQQIPQERSALDMQAAVSKSVQELRTDLELRKIEQEDLDHIQAFLEEESSR
jgi:hypothetical protein